MQHFNAATLVYVAQSKKRNGSPIELEIRKIAKVKEVRNFSLNFYTSQGTTQRNMRNSRNLVVPMDLTKDIIEDGLRYELLYVEIDGLKYHIQNILNYYKKSLQALLDIEELR